MVKPGLGFVGVLLFDIFEDGYIYSYSYYRWFLRFDFECDGLIASSCLELLRLIKTIIYLFLNSAIIIN